MPAAANERDVASDLLETGTYIVDLADMRGTLDRPSALHRLTKAVEDLAGKLGNRSDGTPHPEA